MKKRSVHTGLIKQLRQLNIRLIAFTLLIAFTGILTLPKLEAQKQIHQASAFTNLTSHFNHSNGGEHTKIDKSQGLYFSTQDLLESEEEAELLTNKKAFANECQLYIPLLFNHLITFAPTNERVSFLTINENASHTKDYNILYRVFRI